MRRRDFLRAFGSGAVAASLGVSTACRPRSLERLTIAASFNVSMAPLYLALEENGFVEAGLDLRIERFQSTAAMIPPLAGGQLDVAFAPLSGAVVNAARRGSRLRVVAGREYVRPGCREFGSLLFRRAAFPGGLDDLAELRGRRVTFSSPYPSSVFEFIGDLMLERAGLTADDIRLVDLLGPERVQALLRGDLDAAMLPADYGVLRPEMTRDLAYASGAGRVAPGFQCTFILFGSRLLTGDPAIGTRFLAVYLRSVRAFVAGRDPMFLREFAESNRLDYELLRNSCREGVSLDGSIDAPSVQRYIDWAVRKGYVEGAVAAADVTDSRFVTAAAAAAEHA